MFVTNLMYACSSLENSRIKVTESGNSAVDIVILELGYVLQTIDYRLQTIEENIYKGRQTGANQEAKPPKKENRIIIDGKKCL